MAQGLLTKDTDLLYKDGATFKPIPYLLQVPEIGGDPEQVDVTTLQDANRKYIPGIKDFGDLQFQFLYDNSAATSNYRVLKGLGSTVTEFKVAYPDGTAHAFSAIVNVKMDSAAPNAALTFTATFFLQSDIVITDPPVGGS